jgi:UDP-glucuronate 4-epimerase
LFNYIDFKPETSIEDGIDKFVEFYLKYHGINE